MVVNQWSLTFIGSRCGGRVLSEVDQQPGERREPVQGRAATDGPKVTCRLRAYWDRSPK